MPRYNTCPETAVSKAAAKLYPGMSLEFNQDANNDQQCDFNIVFGLIHGDDLTIADSRLGGHSAALRIASEKASKRALSQTNMEDTQIITLFETYQAQELASIMPDIESVLIENIQKLDQNRIYLLRTGIVEGAGHFHTLYYDGSRWILDSGYKNDETNPFIKIPNIGVLFDTNTNKLGPMSKELMDISSDWGQKSGQRMLQFYEMNRERVLIAARYIEKFRKLSSVDAQNFYNQEEYLNEIISQPNYLDGLGQSDYWNVSGRDFDPVTYEEYINLAKEQCLHDLTGAVNQLEGLGFFENSEEDARYLLINLIANNNFEAVKEILDINLVDLSHADVAKQIYENAFAQSNTQPGLNRSLRSLQDKLLDMPPEQLPFPIVHTCLTLNADALQTMLAISDDVNLDDLKNAIHATATECESTQSTYLPLLNILEAKSAERNSDTQESTRPTPNRPSQEHQTLDKKPSFFNSDITKSRLREQQAQNLLARRLLDIKERTASATWEKARDILLRSQEKEKSNPSNKKIDYTLTAKTGEMVTIKVSKEVQIAMDEIYAKKLQAEELDFSHFPLIRSP